MAYEYRDLNRRLDAANKIIAEQVCTIAQARTALRAASEIEELNRTNARNLVQAAIAKIEGRP